MRGLFGGGRGRGILRSPQRPVRAAAPPEPFSSSATANTNTIASSNQRKSEIFNNDSPNTSLILSSGATGTSAFSSLINHPSFPLGFSDESEWECVDSEDEREPRDCLFGSVPSRDEVHHALSALQQVVGHPSSCNGNVEEEDDEDVSPMDWVEPSPLLFHSKTLRLHGSVYDTFHLLETEPSVQRMVVSLSSDRAVWEAVLNNEVVKELRGSITPTEDRFKEVSCDEENPVKKILSWVVVNGKAKIMELIEKLMKLAFGTEKEGKDDPIPLQEKIKTSLLLSIVVLFIVVISRTNTA